MNLLVIGNGKMGKTIAPLAKERGHLVTIANQDFMREARIETLKQFDAAIDFTTPESAYDVIVQTLEAGVPIVSGTTGWLEKLPAVHLCCLANNGAFLHSSNFSLGVNLFFYFNQVMAKVMNNYPEYAPSLQEIHHTEKKDAPSGTAISTANQIIKHLQNKESWQPVYDNSPQRGEILPIRSLRIKDEPGTHTVTWASEIDSIGITHKANNRIGFAQGAILAAEWIRDKHGIFSMHDVLDLPSVTSASR